MNPFKAIAIMVRVPLLSRYISLQEKIINLTIISHIIDTIFDTMSMKDLLLLASRKYIFHDTFL